MILLRLKSNPDRRVTSGTHRPEKRFANHLILIWKVTNTISVHPEVDLDYIA